ncbi:hypothetical protein FRB94_013960 [Tulasnella sp. JGI-2019a]|nr:hypothetical protein FRB94_013960 [Tulasnella sp. JGI-2019a]
MSVNRPTQLLTWPYYIVFTWFETSLAVIVAIGWILDPAGAYNEMVPDQKVYTNETMDPRTRMTMFQLAVAFFLSSSTAASLLSGLPKQPPRFQHYILIRLIPILTVIDSAHIALTIYALDEKMRMSPATWNTNLYMNCGFPLVFIAFRICWILGVGRPKVTENVGIGREASRKDL